MSILKSRNHFAASATAIDGVVAEVLKEEQFINRDIGPLNQSLELDDFIISIPKCGTTSIHDALHECGRRGIHSHSNESTYEAFENGGVLLSRGIGMEDIVWARSEISGGPVNIYFGYREPVSWYLSLAGHFGLEQNPSLGANIVKDFEYSSPWNKYKIRDIAEIILKATGLNLLSAPIDRERGFAVFETNVARVIVYRIDRMGELERYVKANISIDFALTPKRVNNSQEYLNRKGSFRLSEATLREIYADPWFNHFYSESDRNVLLDRYAL